MPSGAVEIKSQSADPFMVNGQRLKHYTNSNMPTYYSRHDLIEPPFATQAPDYTTAELQTLNKVLRGRQPTVSFSFILVFVVFFSFL